VGPGRLTHKYETAAQVGPQPRAIPVDDAEPKRLRDCLPLHGGVAQVWSRRLVRYRIKGGRAFPGGHPPALKPPEPSQTIRSQPPLIEPDMKFSCDTKSHT